MTSGEQALAAAVFAGVTIVFATLLTKWRQGRLRGSDLALSAFIIAIAAVPGILLWASPGIGRVALPAVLVAAGAVVLAGKTPLPGHERLVRAVGILFLLSGLTTVIGSVIAQLAS